MQQNHVSLFGSALVVLKAMHTLCPLSFFQLTVNFAAVCLVCMISWNEYVFFLHILTGKGSQQDFQVNLLWRRV